MGLSSVFIVAAAFLAKTLTTRASTLAYDGKLRKADEDGRFDAYLVPPFASNHASFVEHDGSDGLLMAWFSGSAEGQDDVSIVVSKLRLAQGDDGSYRGVWSNATVVSRRSGYSNQNPVLFSQNGTMHLFHSQQGAGAGESHSSVWYLRRDKHDDWSAPTEIFGKAGSFLRNRLLLALDGTWELPMYYANTNVPHIKTLGVGKNPAADLWGNLDFGDGCDELVQPSIVRPVPGEPNLVAYFRDRRKASIYAASSDDDGASWTKCSPTKLPNPNSGIQALALSSGRIALVYNPQTGGRDPLVIALSEDGGRSFPHSRVLEHEDGKQEFSYPTLVEGSDSSIHVSYTYKREAIKHSIVSEEWIMG